jgi:hypothetical protein
MIQYKKLNQTDLVKDIRSTMILPIQNLDIKLFKIKAQIVWKIVER